jgi:broad specificity phosphatase PhoE
LKKEGRFLYRPLGGESWYDVKDIRVSSFLNAVYRDHTDENILVISHFIVTNCFRMKLGHLDEASMIELVDKSPVGNCGLVVFEADPAQGGFLTLKEWNKKAY